MENQHDYCFVILSSFYQSENENTSKFSTITSFFSGEIRNSETEFTKIIQLLKQDKDIETVNLSYIIEELFINLMHKKYGEENDNFSCIVNMDKGEIEIYQEMTDKVLEPLQLVIMQDYEDKVKIQ